MFATLLGPYPPEPGIDDPQEAVHRTVAELEEAGLEPLTDGGEPLAPGPGIGPEDVVARWRRTASLTDRAVKQSLVGPYTLARRGEDGGSAATLQSLAERLRETVRALAAAGCPLVEIDEAAAVEIGEDQAERERFADALRRLTEGVANDVHLSLALTGGNVDTIGARVLFDLPFASYAFDLIAGPDNWRLIAEAPGDRGIVCGALDPAATGDDRPEILVWAAHYAASTGGRGLARVGLANASSLAALGRERARRKIHALAEAARIASVGEAAELAAMLDPRAVDIRSAATGRYSPPRGRRSRP